MSANSQQAEFSMGESTHFLVQFNILDNFEGKSKVAKQNVYAQEPDETEIPEHVIERQRAVIAHDLPLESKPINYSTRRVALF
jgi:hypothetical protein